MFRFLIITILLFLIRVTNAEPPYGGLYTRVEPGQVITEMISFIEDNKLTNCFAQRINTDLLSLKCMIDGEIKEVIIEMYHNYEEKVVYITSIHPSFSEGIVV